MMSALYRLTVPGQIDLVFGLIASLLRTVGLSLENPGNGRITSCTDEGEQISFEEISLQEKIGTGEITNVQFWKSEEVDVFVAWSRNGSAYDFSLYLDGVDVEFSTNVAKVLIDFYLRKRREIRLEGEVFSLLFE
ncbi:hypothetical protein [Paraburkholderia antibiotica]|uniref:Uncharacterized protein n=1 Tax=Paraburkholderia antibiotica TaxID=2728839 RepID=A0A7X9X4L3_9BURK|nr:hypothetical protein [Paraburkholderia antibiotica]NML31348.1 hypothetical protein [Paraburkholderia antibiotica]